MCVKQTRGDPQSAEIDDASRGDEFNDLPTKPDGADPDYDTEDNVREGPGRFVPAQQVHRLEPEG